MSIARRYCGAPTCLTKVGTGPDASGPSHRRTIGRNWRAEVPDGRLRGSGPAANAPERIEKPALRAGKPLTWHHAQGSDSGVEVMCLWPGSPSACLVRVSPNQEV